MRRSALPGLAPSATPFTAFSLSLPSCCTVAGRSDPAGVRRFAGVTPTHMCARRQVRIDSKIVPGAVKEGMKIRTEGEEAAATEKVNLKL